MFEHMKICKDPKGSRKAVFGGDLLGTFETEYTDLGSILQIRKNSEGFGIMSGPVLDVIWNIKLKNQGFCPPGTYQIEVDRNNLDPLLAFNRRSLHSGVEGLSIVLRTYLD